MERKKHGPKSAASAASLASASEYIYIYIVITVTIKLLSVFSRWIWWKHGGFWSCDRPGGSYRQKEFKVLYHIILFELACLLTYPFFRFSMGFIPVWCWCIPARSSSVSHGFAALVLAMDCFALYSNFASDAYPKTTMHSYTANPQESREAGAHERNSLLAEKIYAITCTRTVPHQQQFSNTNVQAAAPNEKVSVWLRWLQTILGLPRVSAWPEVFSIRTGWSAT